MNNKQVEKNEYEKLTRLYSECMIDLHLHLDGAISVESAKKLADLQGIHIPEDDAEVRKLLVAPESCRNLNDFLKCFAFPCSLMQTETGLRNAAENLGLELKNQGLAYAEIRFAPQLHCEKGLSQHEIVQFVIDGFKKSGLLFNLILCCMRGNDNKAANMETVEVARDYLGKGVVLLDLAGAEALFTTKDFSEIFNYAKSLNVPFTIHAGEADGPESVKEAIDFGAVRIGHGVRSTEDEALIKELAEKKIPLELCPTSNLMTCIYKDISEYPVRKLMDAGVIVTINTDDPAIEGTNIRSEYELLIREFNLNDSEVKGLLLNSVDASFAEESVKEKLREKILNIY